jgi:hypothetical protein
MEDSPEMTQPPQNWIAAYQIWSLETMSLRSTLRFEIPSSNILHLTKGGLGGSDIQGRKFRFPVALSSSLRTILMMGIVIQIPTAPSNQQAFLQQVLHDSICPYGPDDEIMLQTQNLHKPRYPLLPKSSSPTFPSDPTKYACHSWLRYYFSPCERYIFAIKGTCAPSNNMFAAWILDVYHNIDNVPNYQLIATSGVRFNSKAGHAMLFHPTKPVIALSLMTITAIWRFTQKGRYCNVTYRDIAC